MGLCVGRLIGPRDLAVGTDEDGHPRRLFLIGACRGTVGHCDGTIGVPQQLGLEPDLIPPGLQILGGAEGNAQQYGVLVGEILGSSTEPIGFLRSPAAKGARKEPDQNISSRVIRKADILAVLIRQGEIRRNTSHFR